MSSWNRIRTVTVTSHPNTFLPRTSRFTASLQQSSSHCPITIDRLTYRRQIHGTAANMTSEDFRPADLLPSLEPPNAPVRPKIPTLSPRIVFTAPSQDPSSNQKQQWISTTHVYPAAWPRSHVRSAKSDVYDASIPSTSSLGPLPSDPQAAKAEQRRRREADFDDGFRSAEAKSPKLNDKL